jgi:hypothetical protein
MVKEGLYHIAKTKRHGVWVPAFAGTTERRHTFSNGTLMVLR